MGKKQKMGRIPRGAMKQQSMPRMPQMSQEELQMLAAQQQAMQMDPNLVYIWPRDAESVDYSRFVMVWPAFINSRVSIPKGRRISKEDGCLDPIVQEMSEVCQYYQLTHCIEPYKNYPRQPGYPGRVRVRLLDENGEPCNPDIPNKKVLMRKMGELIPRLQSRQIRIVQAQARIKAAQEAQAAAAAGGGSAKKKSTSKKKKKGKR